MRNLFSIAVLFVFIQPVFAAGEDPYIQTVKEMYKLGAKSQDGMTIIERYSDSSLKQAFNLHAKNGEVCGFGQDVMWQSQDPNYNRPVNFSKISQNKVKAVLGQSRNQKADTVVYTLKCSGTNCKVSDVQDSSGSLKNNILQDCK